LTGLDFLSNLSDKVENRIESNKDFQVYVSPSFLLADQVSEDASSQNPKFFFDTSVRHNCLVKDNFMDALHEVKRFSIFEISPSEVSENSTSLEQFRFNQVSRSEIRFNQISSGQISSFQNSTFQGSALEVRFNQTRSIQISVSESDPNQIGTTQVSTNQIGTTQVSTDQIRLIPGI
jgi:hypothetical protein